MQAGWILVCPGQGRWWRPMRSGFAHGGGGWWALEWGRPFAWEWGCGSGGSDCSCVYWGGGWRPRGALTVTGAIGHSSLFGRSGQVDVYGKPNQEVTAPAMLVDTGPVRGGTAYC